MEEKATGTQVEITLNKPAKFLYFSDGVDEVMEEEEAPQSATTPTTNDESVDPKSLTWGPWVSHYAWKSGTKVLDAVDFAGENLAWFFGITTPKYQIEIDEYNRMQEEKKRIEEENAGWIPNNAGGDIPLVTEPVSSNMVPKVYV